MAPLRIRNLAKHYGSVPAVDGVDLDIADREFMTLLGPSGSGKTSVLRMIAGYVTPDRGSIQIGGRDVHQLPPERRDIGMVFQSYALFPHMTVARNVAFGLERRRVPRAERDRRTAEVLELVRLSGLEQRYPNQLSGGQQQRVALARALVIRPTLLLLDEPLSNLDAQLRAEVRLETRQLQKDLGITTLLVTHDQEEALIVSDRIAVMRSGRVQQVATPGEVYRHPANRFVAGFVGRMSFLRVQREGTARGALVAYRAADATSLLAPIGGPEHGLLAIRPEALHIGDPPLDANTLTATLDYTAFVGEVSEMGLHLADGTPLVARGGDLGDRTADVGRRLAVWWRPEHSVVLDDSDTSSAGDSRH